MSKRQWCSEAWERAVSREASIEFDTSVEQSASLMGPADLLASAFAACVLKNVERFARMLSFTYATASIRVILERQDRPPRITSVQYELHLVTAEPQHRVDLLHRNLMKHGTTTTHLRQLVRSAGRLRRNSQARSHSVLATMKEN